MPTDTAIAISSVASGSFALLGVAVSNRMTRNRERGRFRSDAALALADLEAAVWGDNWIELQAEVQRQQARLTIAGVGEDLAEALALVAVASWADRRAHVERVERLDAGIRSDLLDARQFGRSSCARVTARRGQGRRRDAVGAVTAAVGDRASRRWLAAGASQGDDVRCETVLGRVRRR